MLSQIIKRGMAAKAPYTASVLATITWVSRYRYCTNTNRRPEIMAALKECRLRTWVPGTYLNITYRIRTTMTANKAQERKFFRWAVKKSLLGNSKSSTWEYTTDPEKKIMTTNGARMVIPNTTPIILMKLGSRSTFQTLLNTCLTVIIRDRTIHTKEAMEIKPKRPLSAVCTILSAACSSLSTMSVSRRLLTRISWNFSRRPRPSVR